MVSLSHYPKLEQWFADQPLSGDGVALPTLFVRSVCESLRSAPPREQYKLWSDGFAFFIEHSESPNAEFYRAEEILAQGNLNLIDLIAAMGETAIRTDQGEEFLKLMKAAATRTGLIHLRFFCAWAAFNMQDYDDCFREIAAVPEPLGPFKALQGQALLEMGKLVEARDALLDSCSLDPENIVAWFQLAKVQSLLGAHGPCWQALLKCDERDPGNEETALFLGITALKLEQRTQLEIAWERLYPCLGAHANNGDVVATLVNMATALHDKGKAESVIRSANLVSLALSNTIVPLGQTLQALGKNGWYDLAQKIIDALAAGVG